MMNLCVVSNQIMACNKCAIKSASDVFFSTSSFKGPSGFSPLTFHSGPVGKRRRLLLNRMVKYLFTGILPHHYAHRAALFLGECWDFLFYISRIPPLTDICKDCINKTTFVKSLKRGFCGFSLLYFLIHNIFPARSTRNRGTINKKNQKIFDGYWTLWYRMFIFSAMPESSAWQQICRWQMMEEEAAHKEEDAIHSGAALSTFQFSRERNKS